MNVDAPQVTAGTSSPNAKTPKADFGCGVGCLVVLALLLGGPCWNGKGSKAGKAVAPQQGNLAKRGGSATVRESFTAVDDDSETSNDESNDQPVGHFGTLTLSVRSIDAGNDYTLDGELDGFTLERLYFPKGGWVDLYDCELDEDYTGECDDEEGRSWEIRGEY